MYSLKFSKEAERDLDRLFEYIFSTLSVPQSAKRILAEIENKIRDLTSNPFICPICQESPMRELQYRKLVIKNGVVIFGINEINKAVNIVRVFYGGQDYTRYLN